MTGLSVVPTVPTSARSVLMCCRSSNEWDLQREVFAGILQHGTGPPADRRKHAVNSSTQLTMSDGWGRWMVNKDKQYKSLNIQTILKANHSQ